jgi:hypothetical protein
VFVVSAVHEDDRFVQARFNVLRVQLGCLLEVQEGLLISSARKRHETQVVPDKCALSVEGQRLAQRRLGQLPLLHFIVNQSERVVRQNSLGDVFSCLAKRDLRLGHRLFQITSVTQHLDVTVAQLHVSGLRGQPFAVQLCRFL